MSADLWRVSFRWIVETRVLERDGEGFPTPDEIIGSSEMAMRAAPERSFGRRRKLFAGADATRAARSESPDFGRKAEPGLKADAWGTTAWAARAARTAAPATAPRRNTISLCRNSSLTCQVN